MKYTWLQRLIGIHKVAAVKEFYTLQATHQDLLHDHSMLNEKLVMNNLHRLGEGVVPESVGFKVNSNYAKKHGVTSYSHEEYDKLSVIRSNPGEWMVVYDKDTIGTIRPKDMNWFLMSVNSLLSAKLEENIDIAKNFMK